MAKTKTVKKKVVEPTESQFKDTDITEIPEFKPFTGLTISRDPVGYTPEALLDKAGADKKNRPVFMLKPFSSKQRSRVDSDFAKVRSEVNLWAKEKGIELKKFTSIDSIKKNQSEYSAYLAAIDSLTDNDLRAELVRECLTGVKLKGTGSEMKDLKFVADEDGLLKQGIFDTYHPELVEDLYAYLNKISNPKWDDTLGK